MVLIKVNTNKLHTFSYKEKALKALGITKEELIRLGEAVIDYECAEMADWHEETESEIKSIKRNISDLLLKYNLIIDDCCIKTK